MAREFTAKKVKKVVAGDLDEDFITHNKKINKFSNVEYVSFDAVKKFPFADNTFDTVTLLEVIEHVPSGTEHKALSEIQRVLKKGGKLVLSTPAWHWFTLLCDPAYWLIGHRHYKAEVLDKMLIDAGFSKTDVKKKGGLFDALYVICFYISRTLHLADFNERLFRRGTIYEYKQKRGFNNLIATALNNTVYV